METKDESINQAYAMRMSTMSHRDLESMKDESTRLYLVRHGELTTSNEWKYVGHLDVELNDTGIEQIKRLGKRLKGEGIDVILSSDLKRSAKSAEIIGEMLGLKSISHSDFREINLGHWEGMTKEEIVANFQEEFEKRASSLSEFRIKEGESFVDLRNRVIPRLMLYLDQNKGKNVLLVAHGGVNRVILCHVLGLDLNNLIRIDQAYGCLNIIDYFDGVPVVRLVNQTF
jgi:alpha-ribazole phosphatase